MTKDIKNIGELQNILQLAHREILDDISSPAFNVWHFEPIDLLLRYRRRRGTSGLVLQSGFFEALTPANNAVIAPRVITERLKIFVRIIRRMIDRAERDFSHAEREVLYTTLERWLQLAARNTTS
jgi:hypothetical protein